MFVTEFAVGIIADSTALLGDSLDMLGDSLAYGSSIYVVRKGIKEKRLASKFKAWLMILIGLSILGRAIYRVIYPNIPEFDLMSIMGVIALLANLICLFLLTKHKDDDINFKSVWICSRNDIVANSSVLIAAALIYLYKVQWPDLVVGLGITFLFLKSAIGILKEANSTT
jgi:cation diffusion facilitator family transporter